MKQAIDASSIPDKTAAYQGYLKAVSGKSNSEARTVAQDILGKPVFWDWDRESRVLDQFVLILSSLYAKCPEPERVTTTVLLASRLVFPSFVSDCVILIPMFRWLSSELLLSPHTPTWFGWRPRHPTWSKRNLSLAGFGNSIPESESQRDFRSDSRSLTASSRWLVYNLSPSFNWGAHGFTG